MSKTISQALKKKRNDMSPKIPLLLAAIIIIAFGCIGQVYALENATNVTPIRISQGDPVYLGETVDISAVAGWADSFAYNGGYPPEEGISMVTTKIPDTKVGYYNYYIDPSIYGERLGYWYAWYGKYEPAGNLVAFNVVAGTRPTPNVTVNATNITEVAGNITIRLPTQLPMPLHEEHVSDYLVAIGDPITIPTPNGGKIWIFGTNSYLYDVETANDNLTITGAQTAGLAPGDYTMLIQTSGKNGEFDVRYNKNEIQYRSAWDGVKSESILGIQPLLVVGRLQEILGKTDDKYYIVNMKVDTAHTTIESMYETEKNPEDNFRFDTTGLISYFNVKGYSNLANQTTLKVYLDKTEHVKDLNSYTFTTKTIRSSVGNRSQYECFVPIIWDKMEVGMHTITVESPDGTVTYADFPVSVMPADSYRPNATLKYTGDRNPYVPPVYINTTVTVEKTVEVIKEVKVEVPPPVEVVEAAQRKAVGEALGTVAGCVLWCIVILGIGVYMFSVYRRAKKCQ